MQIVPPICVSKGIAVSISSKYVTRKHIIIMINDHNCTFTGNDLKHQSNAKYLFQGVVIMLIQCMSQGNAYNDCILSLHHNFTFCKK